MHADLVLQALLAAQANSRLDAALGPEQQVHWLRVAGVPKGPWHRPQHKPAWQLPRQRGGGELLPTAEARVNQAEDLSDPGGDTQ